MDHLRSPIIFVLDFSELLSQAKCLEKMRTTPCVPTYSLEKHSSSRRVSGKVFLHSNSALSARWSDNDDDAIVLLGLSRTFLNEM